MAARITVRRERGFKDMLRAYVVLLDGRHVGDLRQGQEITLLTTAGTHELQLEIDWCSSKPVLFSIAERQTKLFECGNNIKVILALLYITVWRGEYLWLRPVP
jgi:hypothetical protein